MASSYYFTFFTFFDFPLRGASLSELLVGFFLFFLLPLRCIPLDYRVLQGVTRWYRVVRGDLPLKFFCDFQASVLFCPRLVDLQPE
jgi:hypothetical protein